MVMPGGLVFVGVLALADLLLILLLTRRVRSLARRVRTEGPGRRPWLAPGTKIPEFEATTVDGGQVSLNQLRGRPSLIGLFSAGCVPCHQEAPAFARHADTAVAPGQALAVVVGPARDDEELLKLLGDRVAVTEEGRSGPVSTAFGARAFPAIYLLSPDGTVIASGTSADEVSGARLPAASARR
jgi:cytochrome oxidase Cu insertion factor (SCO1/SenC/PrrC family)